MAMGSSLRVEARRSTSRCSNLTLAVFVGLCLIGVWMLTSSTSVSVGVSSEENRPVTTGKASKSGSVPVENNSGDLNGETDGGDADASGDDSAPETKSSSAEDQNLTEKTKTEENNEVSKTQSEGREKDGQDGSTEQNPQKDGKTEQSNEETTNNDQVKDEEQNLEDKPTGDEQQYSDGNNNQEQETKSDGQTQQDDEEQGPVTETEKYSEDNTGQPSTENQEKESSKEVFPDAAQSDLLNETSIQTGAWSTQTAESKNEKEIQAASQQQQQEADVYKWKLCNVTAGIDYIPCLDNEEAISKLTSRSHFQHRERHCPDEPPTCLVPLPEGYKRPISWPNSRDKIWYNNVPRTKLAAYKGHQNWVKVTGEFLTFPGGGTQFKNGALHYIDSIQESWPDIAWGKRTRVILDVGCGVASFGGYLFDRDVLTMSFAPKDEHEAQVQFALERGIPAFSAVMGTKRLPFPGMVFDVIHCARCRVPWHIEGGMLLLELNRLLRPGGYFIWSATPVYRNVTEDVEIWKAMSALTKSMCWELVQKSKDELNEVGIAIYRKPLDNSCYQKREENNPPLCQESDDPNAAWSVPLQACMHKLPVDTGARGSKWPELWPQRLEKSPYWLNNSQLGVYGKPAAEDFSVDYEHWKHVVNNSYLNGMGIEWSSLRNVMDMRAVYGGFAAALKDMNVWVMNIVPIDSPDTLPVIYERGLFGMYHDWCESFSSYPRTYDLLHADHLFSKLKQRCKLIPVMAEVDRLLRPEGKLIVRDSNEVVNEIETIAKSLHWEIRMTFSKQNEGLLFVQKTSWRPTEVETSSSSLS